MQSTKPVTQRMSCVLIPDFQVTRTDAERMLSELVIQGLSRVMRMPASVAANLSINNKAQWKISKLMVANIAMYLEVPPTSSKASRFEIHFDVQTALDLPADELRYLVHQAIYCGYGLIEHDLVNQRIVEPGLTLAKNIRYSKVESLKLVS